MNTKLYEMLNSGGEVRIEIGGPDKYYYLSEDEILELLDALDGEASSIESALNDAYQRGRDDQADDDAYAR